MKVLYILLCTAIFLSGCAGFNRVEPVTVTDPEMQFTYAINDRLDVKTTFESQIAYDATQLGLYLLQKIEKTDIPDIEDSDFFPKYFAMVNTDISDGLLFISEKEAKDFACRMYLKYQREENPDYLDVKEKRVLEEIISK